MNIVYRRDIQWRETKLGSAYFDNYPKLSLEIVGAPPEGPQIKERFKKYNRPLAFLSLSENLETEPDSSASYEFFDTIPTSSKKIPNFFDFLISFFVSSPFIYLLWGRDSFQNLWVPLKYSFKTQGVL